MLTAHFIACVSNEFYDSITDDYTRRPDTSSVLFRSGDNTKKESKYQLTYSTDQWAESIRNASK
jgi:hypothetical protein